MVTWTANVAGGPGAWECKFLTFDFRGWLLQQGYSAQNTFTWFPPVGTCTMQVWIRAAGSHATWERYESLRVLHRQSLTRSPKQAGLLQRPARSAPLRPHGFLLVTILRRHDRDCAWFVLLP